MDGAQADPHQVFQSWLDRVGEAIMGGDFETFAANVDLPCILASQKIRHEIVTRDELREGFEAFAASLRGHGAEKFVRRAHHVDFAGPDLIMGFYNSDIIRNSAKVVPSYTSSMLLKRIDSVWKCVEVTSGLANQSYPFAVLRVEKGK